MLRPEHLPSAVLRLRRKHSSLSGLALGALRPVKFVAMLGCLGLVSAAPVDRVSDSILQIGIAQNARRVRIKPQGQFSVIDQSSGEKQPLISGREYIVEADEDKRLTVGPFLFLGQTRLLRASPQDYVLIEGIKYPGNLVLKPNPDGTLTLVEELGLEEYLYGVLPTEMSPDWPIEALKAQAVVARSFALANLGKFSGSGFDLSDDTRSQLYSGLELESERVKRAVSETKGEVLEWQGKNLKAFFHACCGGHTEDPARIWGSMGATPKPLKGVRDRFCRLAPLYRWSAALSVEAILTSLNQHGLACEKLSSVRLGNRDSAGYARSLRLVVDGKAVSIRANDFRNWLGPARLKSTQITRIVRRGRGYEFSGRGYGHGVGLCQWGAKAQAAQGKKYREILSYYFPGAKIAQIEE